jgi:hypothetical protein
VRYAGKIEGDVSLSAQTGSVHMAVDPALPFFLDAESEVGAVRSDLAPRRAASAPGEGEGGASNHAHKVRLRTHTGSIRITRL